MISISLTPSGLAHQIDILLALNKIESCIIAIEHPFCNRVTHNGHIFQPERRGVDTGAKLARKQTLNCLLQCFLSCRRPAYKDKTAQLDVGKTYIFPADVLPRKGK